MILKWVLLCLYLLLLFILSRLLEVASWYSGNMTFINSRVHLDTFSLSVKKLKQLLDHRGVDYCGAVEKKELVQLVEASGTPGDDEVASVEETTSGQTTQFACGSQFVEEVEDTQDSVWLVQIATGDDKKTLLNEDTWSEVVSKVGKFGVRTGVFHCSLDKRLCSQKNWRTPRMILALPRDKTKRVELHTYFQVSKPSKILKWVQNHMVPRVKQIVSANDLVDNWLTYGDPVKKSEIRVVLFTKLDSPPLFYSSLAIKFNGRVKFATVQLHSVNFKLYSLYQKYNSVSGNDKQSALYLVITPEEISSYGSKKGENVSYKHMEMFLKWSCPEMNDIFLLSLFLTNLLMSFEFFFGFTNLWVHLTKCLYSFLKYNVILLLAWFPIVGLYKFAIMDIIMEITLRYMRLINTTDFACLIRYDLCSFCSFYTMVAIYLLFGCISGFFIRKCKILPVEEDIPFSFNWWTSSRSSTVSSYFFRQIPAFSRPAMSRDPEIDENMGLLIERLAVPNLWLHPIISNDYIKYLPAWKYRGWCSSDDSSENKRNSQSSSEDEPRGVSPSRAEKNTWTLCHPPNLSNIPNLLANVRKMVPDSKTTASEKKNAEISSHSLQYPDCKTSCRNNDEHCLSCDICKGFRESSNSSLSRNFNLMASRFFARDSNVQDTRRAPPGMLEIKRCSICLENYRYGELLSGLPCGHSYHSNCIMKWLYRDNHQCPICRWPSYKSKLPHLHSQ